MEEERPADTTPKYEGEKEREGAMKMTNIHAEVWLQMVKAIEKLTREQKKLQKEYEILCDEVNQYSQHVESIEPKRY